jgi:hypothetical protein
MGKRSRPNAAIKNDPRFLAGSFQKCEEFAPGAVDVTVAHMAALVKI